MAEDAAVTNFRNYIRIASVHPDPKYDAAVAFLVQMAEEICLTCKVLEIINGKPIVIMTWVGKDPSLPSLLLNSHMDVVPCFPEHWKCDPFEAVKDEHGNIYGRGTQDMKCVGIQYLEAVRRLKVKEKREFARTIYLTFVPDEEVGGAGMRSLLESKEFSKMNVGFTLDEGLANPGEAYTVFYGERSPWWIKVTCTGNTGHGSRFIVDNAAEKMRKVINSFLDFRDHEEARLQCSHCLKLGDVTTVNLTKIEGGVAHNVVPNEFTICFDIRLPPNVNMPKFEEQLAAWCREAGPGVRYEHFHADTFDQTVTDVSNENPWWKTFKGVFDKRGEKLEIEVFPAATDSRFLRALGYQALGFSPMNHTPILLHDHNEFLNEKVFLKGIEVYCDLIPALASHTD